MNLVGMRFHPTDEEIISHYLVNKIKGNNDVVDHVISEVDVYQQEPWHLPYHSRRQSNDQVWYFFCHLQYSNGGRVNRKISNGTGFWKATGLVRTVRAADSGVEIGKKRTLVFYSKDPSSVKEIKTDWVTHEYTTSTVGPTQLVLWKLKNKGDDWTNNAPRDEGELGQHVDLDENYAEESANLEGDAELRLENPQMHINPEWEMNQFNINEEEVDPAALEFADSCLNDEEIVAFGESSSGQAFQQLQINQDLTETIIPPHEHSALSSRRSDSNEIFPLKASSSSSMTRPQLRSIPVNREFRRVCRLSATPTPQEISSNIFRRMSYAPTDMSREKAREITKLGDSVDVASKESFRRLLEEENKLGQVIHLKPDVKLRSNLSSGNEGKSPLIHPDTPPSKDAQSLPPLHHIINVLVGVILLIIIIREMLIFH